MERPAVCRYIPVPAVDRIRKADIQAARYDWEYESGERAIHVDERALKKDHRGNVRVDNLDKRFVSRLEY